MKSSTLIGLSILATLTIAACGLFKPNKTEESEEKPRNEAPALVGRIASVPADKRFVLVQSYGTWNVETGAILTTRGPEERTANLRVTGESLGRFAAADLQSGTVEVGDAVYSRHVPKPIEPTSTADDPTQTAENQTQPIPGNVQKNN